MNVFLIIVHILFLLFFWFGLLISIPLHILILVNRSRKETAKRLDEQNELLKEQNFILYKNSKDEGKETDTD